MLISLPLLQVPYTDSAGPRLLPLPADVTLEEGVVVRGLDVVVVVEEEEAAVVDAEDAAVEDAVVVVGGRGGGLDGGQLPKLHQTDRTNH